MCWYLSLSEGERDRGGQGGRGQDEQEEALRWAVLHQQKEEVGAVGKEEEGYDREYRGECIVTI